VFRARGIEVLLLCEPVDEWVVQQLTEFDGRPLRSVMQGKLELPGDEETATPDAPVEDSALIVKLKAALEGKVSAVRPSTRLTDSPACLVGDDYDMSVNLQRILRAAGQEVPPARRILEVNERHPLLIRLATEDGEQRFGDLAQLLFDQAVLVEGGRLEDPAAFVRRLNTFLTEVVV
jgi:molecular chaperone HtpG